MISFAPRARLRLGAVAAASAAGLLALAAQGMAGQPATAATAGRGAILGQGLAAGSSPTASPSPTASSSPTASPSPTPSPAAQVRGVDVASFQHGGGQAIGWQQVAAGGYTFAFVKATEGTYYANPYYAGDVAAARAAGLLVAAYHFGNPRDSAGTLQADYALNDAPSLPDGQTLPLVLDIEYDPYTANQCYGLTPTAMVGWIRAFVAEVVRRTGAAPVIYSTAGWWKKCTGMSAAFGADPLWIADYAASYPAGPPLPAGWPQWTYWQYTSTGQVAGIGGRTDVDRFNPGALVVAPPGDQSDPGGATVTLPVRSLNAAAGTALTFTATGLPAGLTIDQGTGVISGTLTATPPATARVTVTVTAPGGASRTLPFTWRIHGHVRVIRPRAQSTASGSPVDLQVGSADGLSGCSLTFSASGLPPGLTISPCGRITGWAGRPGRHTVTVRATDSTGRVAGSVAFPWIITPPPAGVTGRVRLAFGRLCLARPGHVIGVWTCRRSGGQVWDVVQNGTLRLNGRCLAAAAGATSLALRACDRSAGQRWQLGAAGALVNGLTGQCLAEAKNSTRPGTAVTLAACSGAADQRWTLPAGPLAAGLRDRCLAGAPPKSGRPARVWLTACAGPGRAARSWQAWTIASDGSVSVLGAGGRCLAVQGGARAGTPVGLSACHRGRAAQDWQPLPGAWGMFLVNPASGLCLTTLATVPAGRPATALAYCQAGYPRLVWRAS